VVSQNGQVEGDLVQSINENEDGTVYTLTLKDNLFWTDKTPLKSSDIILNFAETKVSYPDDKTIQFKLAEPFSPFLSLLTKPVFKQSAGIGIGTGPYFVSLVKKEDNFVRQVSLRSLDKSLPDLVINFYPNERIAETALEIGNVQSLLGVSDTTSFLDQQTYSIDNRPNYQQLVAIFYNTKDPILSDDNFRLALSFAAPSIAGEKEAITSIPPSSWVFNPDVKDYLDNPTQAKQYLNKVKNGKDCNRPVKKWWLSGTNKELKPNLKLRVAFPKIFRRC